ncbi:hypothetical protein MIND_00904500 [Mycena indigotica]|uniref:F-box domain-containing protein n=1 Tax=Mycena indigotica TaxID=2126181 RepID=A0A8H6W2A0_9AGAR|nr:uncharacterized protein MIND_00904500 [Mycena indigotica]KAF7296739.1 hypothetical protein MIND_00904500 [Mycena indigotica]
MIPSFPQEMIDTIVTHIDGTDTLKTCSLVAEAFRQPSQRGLWRRVVLKFENGECDSAHAILAHLAEFRHLARYVASLTISMTFQNMSWAAVSAGTHALKSLFPLLPNVALLRVSTDVPRGFDSYSWGAERELFLAVVEGFIRKQVASRKLRGLGLSKFPNLSRAFLRGALTACPSISFVDIGRAMEEVNSQEPAETPPDSTAVNITRLKIGIFDINDPPLYNLILTHTKALHTLVLTTSGGRWYQQQTIPSKVPDICLAAKETLKYLAIQFPRVYSKEDRVMTGFLLPDLPHLHYLQIDFEPLPDTDRLWMPSYSPPPRLLDFLFTLGADTMVPSLSKLCLRPDMRADHPYEDGTVFHPSPEPEHRWVCAGLDGILMKYLSRSIPSVTCYFLPRFFHDRRQLPDLNKPEAGDLRLHKQLLAAYSLTMSAALPEATSLGFQVVDCFASGGIEWREHEVEFF